VKVIDLTLEGPQALKSLEEVRRSAYGEIVEEALKKLNEIVGLTKSKEKESSNSSFTPNNLFINGRRGSGKTSILITLKHLLSRDIQSQEYPYLSNLEVIDHLIDTSINTESLTFYLLSWFRQKLTESCHPDSFGSGDIYNIERLNKRLSTCLNLFPKSLITDNFKTEPFFLEESVDKSDLSFRKELFNLIDDYCKEKNKDAILFFVDDLDISFPPERLIKLLTEIYLFLSHKKLIIISSGNFKNIQEIIFNYIKGNYIKDENSAKYYAKSFIEKVFSSNMVDIPTINWNFLREAKIKQPNGEEVKAVNFLQRLPILRLLKTGNEKELHLPYFVRNLLSDISLRELVLILKDIYRKIERINRKVVDNNTEILYGEEDKISDLCLSDTLVKVLNINTNLQIEARKNTKVKSERKPNEFFTIFDKIDEVLEIESKKLETDGSKHIGGELLFFDKEFTLLELRDHLSELSGSPSSFKEEALFKLWFNEHLLFNDGIVRTMLRLLFFELLRFHLESLVENGYPIEDIINSLREFISLWKNYRFSFQELIKLSESFYGFTPYRFEQPITIQDAHWEEELAHLVDEKIIQPYRKPEGNRYLSLLSVLNSLDDSLVKINTNTALLLSLANKAQENFSARAFKNRELFSFISNYKRKVLSEIFRNRDITIKDKINLLLITFVILWWKITQIILTGNLSYDIPYVSLIQKFDSEEYEEVIITLVRDLYPSKLASRLQVGTYIARIDTVLNFLTNFYKSEYIKETPALNETLARIIKQWKQIKKELSTLFNKSSLIREILSNNPATSAQIEDLISETVNFLSFPKILIISFCSNKKHYSIEKAINGIEDKIKILEPHSDIVIVKKQISALSSLLEELKKLQSKLSKLNTDSYGN